MFKEERDDLKFTWNMIGDIVEGRPNLGTSMDVSVYRLMQFTLRDVLIKEFNVETADKIFYSAGKLAGTMFCRELINKNNSLNEFIVELKDIMKKLKMGVLRVEKADVDRMVFTLTVAEDLDCSGLPVCDEQVCTYDEGFISGILGEYTGNDFAVKEIDCWASGDRVCRFDVRLND
ncbi:MAG: 4-vinyl reductase [Desulfobulbaceae bacterium]|nr:4-vinyl reductase [Desulfobulbaceae bacterium]